MSNRQWMKALREAHALTLAEMARRINCGKYLLSMLEEGAWITTPLMAKDIARGYGMTPEQRKLITYVRRRGRAWPKYNRGATL